MQVHKEKIVMCEVHLDDGVREAGKVRVLLLQRERIHSATAVV